jgi:hypothetical protein
MISPRAVIPLSAGSAVSSDELPTVSLDPDVELERRIDHQMLLVWFGSTREVRRAASAEMTRLIGMRSPQRIEQMERERGLR